MKETKFTKMGVLSKDVSCAVERGYYCVKGCFITPEMVEFLIKEGFEIVKGGMDGVYNVSWYNACCGLAAKFRNKSLKIKSEMLERFAKESVHVSGFQMTELYMENIHWLINRRYAKVEVFNDVDGIGLGARVYIEV